MRVISWISDRSDFGECGDYNKYNDYRGSDLDLVLDWKRYSEFVTSDTVDYYRQIAKLESWHWGLVIRNSCDVFLLWFIYIIQY